MSSAEYPSAPRTPSPVAEASEVHNDNRGLSLVDESSQDHDIVRDDSVCKDFLLQHLHTPPTTGFSLDDDLHGHIDDIRKAGTVEHRIYKPAATLLTAISKQVYKYLSNAEKEAHRKRQQIRKGKPGHLTFINHHSTAPTQFPKFGNDSISNAQDAPDLLGVYDVEIFKDSVDASGVYSRVPHHRVEAIVEAKAEKRGEAGRKQAATYAYRHHQARPDRPGLYLLVITPEWYQVLYSDPTGIFASPHTPWDSMDLLVAYVYSHYCPPDAHFLWDETIKWSEPSGPLTFPSWDIRVKGDWYMNGQFIFFGEPWSRLTTTFRALDGNGDQVIIKDSYRQPGRRFKEEDILEHLHEEGDLLGVVRLKVYETFSRFVLKGPGAKRLRVRFVLLDSGFEFETAKTVNDLLKAVYDALEVHRTKLAQRNVLHRDMSLHNVLMYPVWGKGRRVNENSPPMIHDVLSGENRAIADRFPMCLIIDFDNAARLDYKNRKRQDLMQRTGTPMYISRSVCRGEVLSNDACRLIHRMPRLSEKARSLYIGVHGTKRYERYNDTKAMPHGACPPDPEEMFERPTEFYHRSEHDVESVYWSMLSALLRVRPVTIKGEPETTTAFVDAWASLLSHKIPDADDGYTDPREYFFSKEKMQWPKLFLGDMKGIGLLLWDIGRQVRPEYAFCGDGLQPDHLHEAVQRLILQYIVDHDDIPLDPEHLRPIPQWQKPTIPRFTKQSTTQGSGAGSGTKIATRGSRNRASGSKDAGSATKRKSATWDAAESCGSADLLSSGACAAVSDAIVLDPKHKSSEQTERSPKRLRNSFGIPQSIEEDVEGDA